MKIQTRKIATERYDENFSGDDEATIVNLVIYSAEVSNILADSNVDISTLPLGATTKELFSKILDALKTVSG
jgi:hypothetical protein